MGSVANLTELPDWAATLLDDSLVGHLGFTDEDGHPRVQPITFARVEHTIVSAIDDKPKRTTPARIRRLRRAPRAAFTVDRYDANWTKLAWVQVLADVAIEPLDAQALHALQHRYPAYRDRPPPGPLIKLSPRRVLYWRASG